MFPSRSQYYSALFSLFFNSDHLNKRILPFTIAILVLSSVAIHPNLSLVYSAAYTGKTIEPFVTSGTWYEMGYDVGTHYVSEILTMANVFRGLGGVSNMSAVKAYYDQIKHILTSDVLDQIKGMAQALNDTGSVSYEEAWMDILMCNVALDLLFLPVGCTGFGTISEDGKYLAHNSDGQYSDADLGSIIIFKPKNGRGEVMGHSFVSFVAPGFVGVPLGQNDAGITLTYNTVKQKNPKIGLPVWLMIRMILYESRTFDEAIQRLNVLLEVEENYYGAQGSSLLIMDFNASRLARVEIASAMITVIEAVGNPKWIVNTNHYVSQPGENGWKPEEYLNSYIRYDRAVALIENADKRDYNYINLMLRDHGPNGDVNNPLNGSSNTICRHANFIEGTHTSNIFTESGDIYYTILNPCQYQGAYQVVNWLETGNLTGWTKKNQANASEGNFWLYLIIGGALASAAVIVVVAVLKRKRKESLKIPPLPVLFIVLL